MQLLYTFQTRSSFARGRCSHNDLSVFVRLEKGRHLDRLKELAQQVLSDSEIAMDEDVKRALSNFVNATPS